MSLLAPAFLLGLLGIAVPVWLHRLSSENPNKQAFSSLMFLEPGEPRRVLARNLQYLLLLGLRIGFLVLLVLAFAGPAWWRVPGAAAGEDARLELIVLDVSASLAAADRFAEAQAVAGEIVDSLRNEDVGQVVAVGRTAEVLTAATNDRGALRAAINNASPGVFRLDFGRLMRSVDGIVRSSEVPVRIHVITDAQRSGLPASFADLAPAGTAALEIHALNAAQSPANVAVASLGGSPLTGELTAGILSFAGVAAERRVRLLLEDEVLEEHTITVPPGGLVEVAFAPLSLRAGSNRVRVDMQPADDLIADDSRFLALQRPEPRPVLLISADLRERDSLFVSAALETLSALVIEPQLVTPEAAAALDLADYHFVIAADAGDVEGIEAQLDQYIRAGGAALIAAGPRSGGLDTIPVGGQALGPTSLARDGVFTAIGVVDDAHPALRAALGMRAARFSQHASLTPGAGDAVLIELEDGAPLLLERELGRGRILVYASTLDRQWNDLVVHPVFVPFLSGLANHMLGSAGFTSEADLGSLLTVGAQGFSGGQLFSPTGVAVLGLGTSDQALLEELGHYEIVSGGESSFVAVNFDTRESDLAGMDQDSLARWARLGGTLESAQVSQVTDQEPEPLPLGLWILGLLAVLIIVETWAGNWHLRVQRGIAS